MNHRYITPLIAAVALTCATAASDAQVSPMPTSPVVNPTIPKQLTLCGQVVDLDNVEHAERYDRELTSAMYTHGNTLLTIKRANRYFPQIVPILKANGMPEDLVYLACVESTLNPRAVSPAKAAGMWQFMASTAKEYGLEVSDEVDERYNIDKATAAACRFLKKALQRYGGDWNAVFQSYNGGMRRITQQLDEQITDEPLDLYLAEETQRYPFRIMATKAIMENPARYGFVLTAEQLYTPREVDYVEVSGPVASWAQWAKDHGISYNTLRDENPWIRAPKLTNKLGKTYKVRVPRKNTLKRSTAKHPVYNPKWIQK